MKNYSEFNKCNICPRRCMVNRNLKEVGYCGCDNRLKVSTHMIHYWEEPCISGVNGSGAIFFPYCNLKCIYCQNYKISRLHVGEYMSEDTLVDIILKLEKSGVHNIEFVTPTHYLPIISSVIDMARDKGLKVPIVYNTSSYEKVESIRKLKGYVDVYLPDLKYYSDDIAFKYSSCNNYFDVATKSIEEMYKQVGKIEFDSNGMIKKGVIVRHLVLPGCVDDAKKIIKYLYDKYNDNIYISIMNQYTVVNKTKYDNLNRTLSLEEYDEVVNYAYDIGVRCAYIQEDGTCKESFIPDFG